jgi:hypothetical protein
MKGPPWCDREAVGGLSKDFSAILNCFLRKICGRPYGGSCYSLVASSFNPPIDTFSKNGPIHVILVKEIKSTTYAVHQRGWGLWFDSVDLSVFPYRAAALPFSSPAKLDLESLGSKKITKGDNPALVVSLHIASCQEEKSTSFDSCIQL